ncbi:MAG: DNA-processing protein DprA [Alphaproteobacteria bacterium]|nr:DNA-processing protein DprA [Alphaproteobacteria bacterium]
MHMKDIKKLSPKDFPFLLKEIPDAPEVLYVKGIIPHTTKYVAIVGARKHSAYGKKMCEKIIHELAGENICIVSGLAIGIDTIAHETALSVGLPTLAVIGSGLHKEVLYPKSNYNLSERIIEHNGGCISEYTPDTEAAQWHFPARNRIMAGISHVICVIECEQMSGTRITARLATEYNREVGAVPHDALSILGVGCNDLIAQGAHLIREGNDIKKLLGIDATDTPTSHLENITLTPHEKIIYDICKTSVSKNELIEKSKLPVHIVQVALTTLTIKGCIEEIGNGIRVKRKITTS